MSKKPSGEKKPMPQKVYEAYQQGKVDVIDEVINAIVDEEYCNAKYCKFCDYRCEDTCRPSIEKDALNRFLEQLKIK